MKVRSSTFVDERLRLLESDLLVEFRTKGDKPVLVYILWEHQMRVDLMMAWRILCYRVEVLHTWLAENPGASKFPFVYAIVLHQAEENWTAKLDFADLIDAGDLPLDQSDELDQQQLRSTYEVVSVSKMPKLGWPPDPTLKLGLSLMNSVSREVQSDWVREHGDAMNRLLSESGGDAISP